MPFLEFHLPNFLTWFGAPTLSLYVLFLIIVVNVSFIASAGFIFAYLKKYYGARPIPKEWLVFWSSFIFYCAHEILEALGLFQLMVGSAYVVLLSLAEIGSIVLLTWGCYLLVKTYVLGR